MTKKIVIIGPESTGKSTLCAQLADHFKVSWVPEYARAYLLELGRPYTQEDLLLIAQGQLASEETAFQQAQARGDAFLFIDTDMQVMKVWSEFVFGSCHPFILQAIQVQRYNGYLLTNVDLPWVADELREYPDLETRRRLFEIYQSILQEQSTPWALISGSESDRLQAAIVALQDF